MLKQFDSLIASGHFVEKPLTSIRVELHVLCQWRCHFCHMEGNHTSGSIGDPSGLVDALEPLKKKYGLDEVHLTGGEPSIHPQIVEHVRALTLAGYSVKMTTNGQSNISQYEGCIKAGLHEINISIPTLNPSVLGQLMNPPHSKSWGEKAIKRQIALCYALREKIPVKVNTCIGADESDTLKIASFVRDTKVRWRIMKVLKANEASESTIARFCKTIGAIPQRAILVNGTSSCSIDMATADGFSFGVKLIRPLRLQAMCAGCSVHSSGGCFEYAYGSRVEAVSGQLFVRSCLYRNGAPFLLTPQEFLSHQIAKETYGKR